MHLTCFGSVQADKITGAPDQSPLQKTDGSHGPHFSSQNIPPGHTDLQVQTDRAAPHTCLAVIYTHRHNLSVHCATKIAFGLLPARTSVSAKALDTQQKKE